MGQTWVSHAYTFASENTLLERNALCGITVYSAHGATLFLNLASEKALQLIIINCAAMLVHLP